MHLLVLEFTRFYYQINFNADVYRELELENVGQIAYIAISLESSSTGGTEGTMTIESIRLEK